MAGQAYEHVQVGPIRARRAPLHVVRAEFPKCMLGGRLFELIGRGYLYKSPVGAAMHINAEGTLGHWHFGPGVLPRKAYFREHSGEAAFHMKMRDGSSVEVALKPAVYRVSATFGTSSVSYTMSFDGRSWVCDGFAGTPEFGFKGSFFGGNGRIPIESLRLEPNMMEGGVRLAFIAESARGDRAALELECPAGSIAGFVAIRRVGHRGNIKYSVTSSQVKL